MRACSRGTVSWLPGGWFQLLVHVSTYNKTKIKLMDHRRVVLVSVVASSSVRLFGRAVTPIKLRVRVSVHVVIIIS